MSIRAEHLNHIYGEGTAFEQYALKDVSFEIEDGQFIGLIGHTGSGKSTLIQHLNGLLRASSGAIYYNGENIYQDGYDMKALRSKVGLVFQYPEHQLFEVDVFSDVCFGPKNQGLSKKRWKSGPGRPSPRPGLDEKLWQQSPFELSGGQKRRVAIAGVLAMHPEVLILDEPTAGLDPKGRDEILDEISALHRERHMTIILVSHSMEDIARYADRIMVMNHGEKLFDAPPKEVFRHYKELEAIGLAAPQITYIVHGLKGMACRSRTILPQWQRPGTQSCNCSGRIRNHDSRYYIRTILSGGFRAAPHGSADESCLERWCSSFLCFLQTALPATWRQPCFSSRPSACPGCHFPSWYGA